MFTEALLSQRSFLLLLFTFELISFIDFRVNQYWLERCVNDYHICPACFDNVCNDAIYRNHVASFDFGTLNIDAFLLATLDRRNVQPAFWRINADQSKSVIFKHKLSGDKENAIHNGLCEYFVKNMDESVMNCDKLWRNYTANATNEQNILFLTNALKHIFLNGQLDDSISLCTNVNRTQRFTKQFNHFSSELLFWLHCLVNPEIVLFQAFQQMPTLNVYIPRLINTCGFVVVDEYAGMELSRFYDRPFGDRIYLARQLLEAAEAFSLGIHGFR